MKNKKIQKILDEHKYVNLDVGGALNPQKGFVVLDERNHPSVDIFWKLDTYPYPLPENSIDMIKCANVIEHISRENKGFINFMDEMWRILKYDHQIAIATLYYTSYQFYQDPCNVNPCNETTFAYFDPLENQTGNGGALYKMYKPKPWKLVNIAFTEGGLIEVVMEKRRIDKSYLE